VSSSLFYLEYNIYRYFLDLVLSAISKQNCTYAHPADLSKVISVAD